jgi:peroxiredoxin Q/BCP
VIPQAGQRAPEFALENQDGETVSLSDLRGRKVILYFYPKDDTAGCTAEACGIRDAFPRFEARDAVVLGVSPDDVRSHKKFQQKYALPFTLLADPDHAVAEKYGVWGEKTMYGRTYWGVNRVTFLIDEDGRVERVYEKVTPREHAEELLQALATTG